MLTLEGYRESGGVQGALAERADAVFSALTPEQQAMARRALLRLTQPGEGTEDTRRRAGMDELAGGRTDEPAVAAVVQSLVAARLLTTSTDDEDGGAEVEVAHEALIRGWPRLRGWIDEDRAGLRIQHRLSEAAHEWETLGRDEGVLYRGARLAEAKEWRERNPDELNEVELEFLEASSEARDREARAAEARRRKEVRLLRTVAAVLLGGVAIAGAALLVALQQRSDAVRQKRDAQEQRAEAVRQKRTAQEQQRIGRSRELAATSGVQLAGDPVASLRTAVQAVDASHTAQATEALRHALAEAPLVFQTQIAKSLVDDVSFSPSGRRILASSQASDRVLGLDARSGRVVPDLGTQLAEGIVGIAQSSGLDGARRARSPHAVSCCSTPREIRSRACRSEGCTADSSIAFTPDGRRLVTCLDGRSPALWSALTGERVRPLPRAPAGVDASSIALDDGAIDYVTQARTVHVDLATGRARRHRLAAPASNRQLFARPAGLFLSIVDNDPSVIDTRSGRVVKLGARTWTASAVAFSPDRRTVAVATTATSPSQVVGPGSPTNEGQVDVFDVRSGALRRSFLAGVGEIGTLAYSRDGQLLLSAGADGVARLWPAAGGDALGSLRSGRRLDVVAAFSPDAREVVVGSEDGTIRLWRLPVPPARATLSPAKSPVGRLRTVSFAQAGTLAAAVGTRGALVVDTADGRVDASLPGDRLAGAGVSADGRRIGVATGAENLRVYALPGVRSLLRVDSGGSSRVVLSADGRRVATDVALGGAAWDVDSRRVLGVAREEHAVNGDTSNASLSPDGRWLAATLGTVGTFVVDLDAKRRRSIAPDVTLLAPAFSADSRELYATRTNGALWAYDPTSGQGRQVLATQQVGSSVSSHVSASGFTTERFRDRVAVVELASGGQVELLGPFPAGVRTAQIAPDGSRVVVLTRDGTLRIYDCPACAPLPDLLAQARQRLDAAP